MKITLFALILFEILFNWLYKPTENNKQFRLIVQNVLSSVIVAWAVICIVKGASAFFYVYYALIILSCVIKTAWSNENKHKSKVNLICLYFETLLTIVACCVEWNNIIYIILAIAFLMVLIMVHELGHYTAGKILKFKINEFSIGFGPAIFSKTKANGEKFSIRAIPLGGYCAFEGEDEEKETEGAFNKQKPWKRLIVQSAGVIFNFLFGLVMSVVYLCMANYSLPKVISVADYNSNQFMVGDVITEVNGKKFDYYKVSSNTLEQFSKKIAKYGEGEEITLTIIRDGKEQTIVVKKENRDAFRYVLYPETIKENAYYLSGTSYIKFSSTEELLTYLKNVENELTSVYKFNANTNEYVAYTEEEISSLCGISTSNSGVSLGILQSFEYKRYSFGEALLYAFPFCIDVCWLILKVLGGIFTGATKVSELGGTVTTVEQIAKITSIDWKYIFYLIPLISMNLAVFNILPIPALDGARMVFVIIEWIRKKPINRNVEAYIHFFGLIILFALVIFLDFYHIFLL